MAQTAAEQAALLEKRLKDIEALSRQLGENINTINLRPVLDNVGAIDNIFENLNRRVKEAEEGSQYLVDNFKKLVGEIGKSNEGIKSTQKGLKNLSSLAEQLVNHQSGYNNLSSEEVKIIKKKLILEQNRLSISSRVLKEELADLQIQHRLLTIQGGQESKLRSIQALMDKNQTSQKIINDLTSVANSDLAETFNLLRKSEIQAGLFENTLGLTGAAAGSLKKVLNTLGLGELGAAIGLDKAFDAATAKAQELSTARLKSLEDEKKLINQIQNLKDSHIAAEAELAARQISSQKILAYSANKINQLKASGLADDDVQIVSLQKGVKIHLDSVKAQEDELIASRALLQSEEDRLKTVQKTISQYSLFNDKIQVMNTYFKEAGKGLIKMFSDPLFYINLIIDALKIVDKGAGDLAKGFNMTYDEAMNVREELTQIGNLSGDAALNTRALQESMMAIGKSLGSNAMASQRDLEAMTKLREQAGFTNEELLGIEKTSLATGKNLDENVSSLLHAAKVTGLNNKVLLNEKDIMRDVAKASDAIKLSLGGSGEKLGEAAAQARALGMNLSQVDKIAGSLLNFEQSINDEISAELITGKDLNLEQARLYALNNNIAGLSKEIAKNFGSAAEFGKMNRIQQDAIAKAVGMGREELATTLTDQEALKNLSGDKLADAQAALSTARAQGMSEKQIAEMGYDNLMKQQSAQERLTMAVEKMKEIFVSIAEPIMTLISPIIDILMPVLSAISGVVGFIAGKFGGLIKILAIGYGIVKGFQLTMKAIATTQIFLNSLAVRGNILKGIGHTLTLGMFRTDVSSIALHKLKLAQQQGSLTLEQTHVLLKNEGLGIQIRGYAMYLKERIQQLLGIGASQTRNIVDNEGFLIKMRTSLLTAKDFIIDKATIAFKFIRNGLEIAYNVIKRVGKALSKSTLLIDVGKAAMGVISSLSNIPVIGWVLGGIAAAAVIGMGMAFANMGDGEFPGAGKGPDRTITSKGKMYAPAADDNIYVTPQKMQAVSDFSSKGNGGTTNASPNQFQQQSPSVVNVQPRITVEVAPNDLRQYNNQQYKTA